MITPEEIRAVTFDKGMRGYRIEDVDAFLQQAASDMEQLIAEKEETEQKLYILAEKIEEYRKDEDNLKTALLNAQRMGENVIREAKQKAESMLRKAGIQADDLTRIAREQVEEQEQELERAKAEVAQFKNSVLSLYKQHIESLSRLPGEEEMEEEIAAPAAAAEEFQKEETVLQPAAESAAEPEKAFEETQEPAESFPDLASLYEDKDAGWKLTEEETQDAEPEAPEEETESPRQPARNLFEGFQGIKFSD